MSWTISESGSGDNTLYSQAGTPSLDLRFASTKTLNDYVTGSNLVDHTRASSGTYVGSDGLIKTAVTNLLLQSEDFSTTWTLIRVSGFGSGSISNAITAPNGTLTADKIAEDTSVNNTHIIFQGYTYTSGIQYTLSVYAKAAERNYVNVEIGGSGPFGAATNATFSLVDGSVTASSNSPTTSAVNVGNGWWRLSVSKVTTGSASSNVIVYIADNTGSRVYTGDGTSGIYLWGAQLEQSDTVGEYVKTTSTINSAPRFDHDPTTGESLGLLVEESRTNLLTYSEDFSQADWTQNTNVTLAASNVAAPDGTFTATTASNPTTGLSRVGLTVTGTSTTNYVGSVWARRRSGTGETYLRIAENVTQAITLTNDWQRVWATDESTTTTIRFYIDFYDTGNAIDIWGAQLEEGSFPTSYIPTEGSTVTRAADVASISGSNFSGWYDVNGGTVFSEFDSAMPDSSNVLFSWTLWNSGFDYLAIRTATGYSPDRVFAISRVSGSNTFTSESNSNGYINMPISMTKNAFAFAANSFGVAWDGGTPFGSASGAIPSGITNLDLGSQDSSNILNGHIGRLTYWPQRLPNDTLQTITQ